MSRLPFSEISRPPLLNIPTRDSLELASLAETESESRDGDVEDHDGSSSLSGPSSSRRLSLENEDPLASPSLQRTPGGRMNRSYSVSSAFDFTPTLFPLSSTVGTGYTALGAPSTTSLPLRHGLEVLEKNKSLTYLNGLSLVVGLIIGSGIFSSPSQVNIHVGSPGASLIVWLVSGLLAWTGAASYAELGGAIPLNGGAQVYLAKIFGELMGFLFTWTAILVLKPGSAAIIAIILGEYVVRTVIGAEVEAVSPWINKAPAFAALVIVTLLNCISTRLTARVGDLFMVFKFVALFAITLIGVIVALTGLHSGSEPANTEWKTQNWFANTSHEIRDWAVALYAGLWAFDGWDNTNYVTGEFKNASRDLPKVLHTAMPAVILCYLAANVAYVFVLPWADMNRSNAVAVFFGSKVFGTVGSLVLALIVSLSAFGALNATTFTSGRLIYVAGREGYLPELFGKIGFGPSSDNNKYSTSKLRTRSIMSKALAKIFGDRNGELGLTPVNAILLNALLTTAYIIVGEFRTLITFYGCAGYTFYFLTVLGLIVLRIREPHLERPYKTWLVTPVTFCCVSLFLVSRAVVNRPGEAALVTAFVVAGVPVYYIWVRGRDGVVKKNRMERGLRWWEFWRK